MTETRTPLFGLPQYSDGSDGTLSRADSNEAFGRIEARAAFDDGSTGADLPSTNLLPRRYFRQTFADGYAIHRYQGGWEFVGGSVVPDGVTVRNRTDADADIAFTVDQGSGGGGVRLAAYGSGELASAAALRGMAGAFGADLDTALNPATLGRLHVRSRASGERGLVIRPFSAEAGPSLVVQDTGASDVLVVDALGRLHQRTTSAFGGASPGATAAVTVAPSTSDSDGVVTGLLVHGVSGSPTREGKSILRALRGLGDETSILDVSRDRISLGRLPWATPGSGTLGVITAAANRHVTRVSGSSTTYAQWRRSDVSSEANEADTTKDTTVMSLGNGGLSLRLPLAIAHRELFSNASLTVDKAEDFTVGFVTMNRLVPNGEGGEAKQSALYVDSSGRISSGAWWKNPNSPGTLRDTRQPIVHAANKRYATISDGFDKGLFVAPNSTEGHVWPTMVCRSGTAADLDIRTVVQALFYGVGAAEVATSLLVTTDISVDNGTTWTELYYTVADPVVLNPSNSRPAGVTFATHHVAQGAQAVAGGGNFLLRTRFYLANNAPSCRIRQVDIRATECVMDFVTEP